MICGECGSQFDGKRAGAAFCCDACRKAWNNRRAERGVMLYDLVMSLRHERGLAKSLKVFGAISRFASVCRERDRTERAGRRSWRPPADVMAAAPWLRVGEGRV